MSSNFLSTLDFSVSLRHQDSSSTSAGGTGNGRNHCDTQPIPVGSSTPMRSPLGSTTAKELFTNAGENEAENSERVFVSSDGVFYENQTDGIRSSLEDLKTVWSQETISITPKKHSNRFAELMKHVREFKAESNHDNEEENNSVTEETSVHDYQNQKYNINLKEVMQKLAEFRSEIRTLRDALESERNGNLSLRHDIEVHKQDLLRQIEVQKSIIGRQQEINVQKELESCRKECDQKDSKIRDADVEDSVEAAREAQIGQYRDEVAKLQKFFEERIQEMSSERQTYTQTVQQLNTRLLEYENEITRLRCEMETERKHIVGSPSPYKYGNENSPISPTRRNHDETDNHKSYRTLNERTERFETSGYMPTLLDSSKVSDDNSRNGNISDKHETQKSEVNDNYVLESGEDKGNRELSFSPSDMTSNRPTTAFMEEPFTPSNILHKDYSHPYINKDEFSEQEISQSNENFDAHEECLVRDSPRDYGYDNYRCKNYLEAQKKFPSEIELEEILNGGDKPGKLPRKPGNNFNGTRHHSLDTMVSQGIMHEQVTRHVWNDITNTHTAADQVKYIRTSDTSMHTGHSQSNLSIFPRMYSSLDVIQEESTPCSPDIIGPDALNVSYRCDKVQQPCDNYVMHHSEANSRSCPEHKAHPLSLHVSNETQNDLGMTCSTYHMQPSTSDYKTIARDMAEAYHTNARKDMYHVQPDEPIIIALKKEIDELRKDFEKFFQTKSRDHMSVKEATDTVVNNWNEEIPTSEKDEDENKSYPVTEDDKLIECLRNEVQQLKKNMEKIEISKLPVQTDHEDITDIIRKEIETIKMEQEKNKTESNISTVEDMAVVIRLLKKEIESIKNDPGKSHEGGSTTLVYEDVIRRLQNDIEKLKREHDKRQDLERTACSLVADVKTLKNDLDRMKKEQNKISKMGIDPSNQEVQVTKANELESRQQEKEMYQLKEMKDTSLNYDKIIASLRNDIDQLKQDQKKFQLKEMTSTSLDYDEIIESLRNDIDQLKQDQKKRQDTEMVSTTEAKIIALVKDMEHVKQEQEKICILHDDQENRRQLEGTYIGVIRKEIDGIKRDQDKLKQQLEGRPDFSCTSNKNIETLEKDEVVLKMEKQSQERRNHNSLTPNNDIIETLQKDVDALKMEKQLQSDADRYLLEALKSEVDSLRKLLEQVHYQETDSSTLTPGPSDAEEPVIDTIKEGANKEYSLQDAFDQLCYECKQRDEDIEVCKEDIKKLLELLQNSFARVDNEHQTHVETINEKLAKYSESINKVLAVTKMQSENIDKLVHDTEHEKMELRAEVAKYRNLAEGTLELQQEVESLKKSLEQVFTLQQENQILRTHTAEMDVSTKNRLQEMSKMDSDILLRLENVYAVQVDQTKKIASLTETLGKYTSEFQAVHKSVETQRKEILCIQKGLQKHRQELKEDLNTQLMALETHKKETKTKTDAIQAELQELHMVNAHQCKLQWTGQVTELSYSGMKNKIAPENIPVQTSTKVLGLLAADGEHFEGGLQRRANVKDLEVFTTVDEIIDETQDRKERSTMSSWFRARQRKKAKPNSCLGYFGRICCTALPLILLLLMFLILALFVPFFHECCSWTNTYRHSPLFFRYVDGPPPT